jgi:hypothetical protein
MNIFIIILKIQSECKIRIVKVRCKSYQVKCIHFPGKPLKMADSLQKPKVPTSEGADSPWQQPKF